MGDFEDGLPGTDERARADQALGNYAADSDVTNIVIRKTFLDKEGNTRLEGEVGDLKNNRPFKKGQQCFISRIFAFGNLHDSDKEKSTFTFHDNSYGKRYGQSYPLFNWCIIFRDLVIAR